MAHKTTTFQAAHYPNTYMEQLCKALHPDLDLGTVCASWFRQATTHCTDLLNDVKLPSSCFWATVKNFIFPDRTSTELISHKKFISIHPQRLTVQDCQSLLLDIVRDYVQRAPRYAAESKTNVMLWQILYSLMGIMALGTLLVATIFIYNKYGHPKKQINLLEEFFKSEKRMQAIAKRSLNLGKAELRNIHVKPAIKVEDIVAPDGAEVLVCKIGTKYELLESIVAGSLQTVGKFHRIYDQHNKTKMDFKIEALKKAMKFLDNNCKKLHFLLVFKEDEEYGEEPMLRKNKINSPRIKSLSPPTTASRISSTNNKRRLEGGDMANKFLAKTTEAEKDSKSPRFYKQAGSSPRSSGVATSGIPRNATKRLPLHSTKSK